MSILNAEGLRYALLPALNLALFKLSLIIRLTRAQVREQALLDYIRFARAKGLPRSRVIGVHLLKNIMIPLVTVIGLELGSVIAFAIVTETIFAWPGMGKLVIDSIFQLDRPVVVAYLLVVVFMFILINLAVDMLYAVARPAGAAGGRKSRAHAPPAEFLRSRLAAGARRSRSRVLALLVAAGRAVRALDRAAESLRPGASSTCSTPACRRVAPARTHCTYLARHGRPGPGHAVGDLLRPARVARGRRGERRDRARAGRTARRVRRLRRRPRRAAADARGGHPARLPRDPGRADPDRGARQGSGQDHRRAGLRAMGLLRAHRALGGDRRAAARNTSTRRAASGFRTRASCCATCCRTRCRR